MHHAYFPCPQNSRVSGSSNTTTLVPGGAKGVLLKTKYPSKCACADSYGRARNEWIKFNVISTCCVKWCHKQN